MKTTTPSTKQTPAQAYDEWLDEQIRLGLEDIEAGRVISHEEVKRKSETLLRSLEKKHAKKAA